MRHPPPVILITCSSCHASFRRSEEKQKTLPLIFCPYCGHRFANQQRARFKEQSRITSASLLQEHIPSQEEIQGSIGQYQIIRSLGKGGMGEVLLVYDTLSGRRIALKRIRSDLLRNSQMQKRFLREARITSQLMHPAIIPIYTIDAQDDQIYYTMPHVEGKTLKQILHKARQNEKKHKRQQDPQSTIAYLVRQFLQVCQAIAYAHAKGVLHRDIKPENVIVGTYGEVLILDWGLAKMVADTTDEGENDEALPSVPYPSKHLLRITRIGKIVGTISYMAPERVLGKPATIQTDIYSLGVMLYQILTLSLPFHRKNLRTLKKEWKKEPLIPPEILAPYREVPPVLSEIAKKCLSKDPDGRYKTVDELILSLENYLEGRSEWFPSKCLDIAKKEDWLFQENILLAEHTAITRTAETIDWVSVMVSKDPFPENHKIEATVRIGDSGLGIGFLSSLPAISNRLEFREGYCLWVTAEGNTKKRTKLLRSSVTVLEAADIELQRNFWQKIRIEKIDHHLYFYLNDVLQFSYISHIPVVGTHIGILAQDADFEIKDFVISIGSQNIMVNCLALPDAFLASKDYNRALSEYRRIGTSFPGRAEGREALFRAGITLLEKAQNCEDENAHIFYDQAQEEFSKLKNTPGAPLEYLGKALIYQTLKEYEEEVKCFELAIRRYRGHPLLPILEEQILLRMHESSRYDRVAAYHFICLVVRFLSHLANEPPQRKLFASLERHWEVPFFFPKLDNVQNPEVKQLLFSLYLGFWLAKPYVLAETITDMLKQPILPMYEIVSGILFAIELGSTNLAQSQLDYIHSLLSEQELERNHPLLSIATSALRIQCRDLEAALAWVKEQREPLSQIQEYVTILALQKAVAQKQFVVASEMCHSLQKISESSEILDAQIIETWLYCDAIDKAEKLVKQYPIERLTQEASPLYFPYGCLLAKLEGNESAMQHFSKVLDMAFPRSWLLGAHYLAGKIHTSHGGWFARSFLWERRKLYNELALFWHCVGNEEKEFAWHLYASKEYVKVDVIEKTSS